MPFPYLIVVRPLVLVRIFGRLPDGVSRRFAGLLEASTRPFYTINYLGSVVGPRMLGYAGLGVVRGALSVDNSHLTSSTSVNYPASRLPGNPRPDGQLDKLEWEERDVEDRWPAREPSAGSSGGRVVRGGARRALFC
jgi:hypothetical protein